MWPRGVGAGGHGGKDGVDLDGEVTEWAKDSGDASDVDNEILFCSYRYDPETALYHVRHRMYHATLGRWLQRDPIGYVDGMSLYGYVGSNPAGLRDAMGRCTDSPKKIIEDLKNGTIDNLSELKNRIHGLTADQKMELRGQLQRLQREGGGSGVGGRVWDWQRGLREYGDPFYEEDASWWDYGGAFLRGVGDVATGIAGAGKELGLEVADLGRGVAGLAAWGVTGDPSYAAGIHPYSNLGKEGSPRWAQRIEAGWEKGYEAGEGAWGTAGGVGLGLLDVTAEVLKMVPVSGQLGQTIHETAESGEFRPEQARRVGRATGEFAVIAGLKKASEWSVKVNRHSAHHLFDGVPRKHLQILIHKPGVSDSHTIKRIPYGTPGGG